MHGKVVSHHHMPVCPSLQMCWKQKTYAGRRKNAVHAGANGLAIQPSTMRRNTGGPPAKDMGCKSLCKGSVVTSRKDWSLKVNAKVDAR